MSPVQLSSKCLSELRKVLQKASKDKDDKLAVAAQAAIEDLNRRIEAYKQHGNTDKVRGHVGAAGSLLAQDDGKDPFSVQA